MIHLSLEVIVTGVLELSLPVRDVVLVDLALVAALRELDHFDLGHDFQWNILCRSIGKKLQLAAGPLHMQTTTGSLG